MTLMEKRAAVIMIKNIIVNLDKMRQIIVKIST